MLSSCIPDIFFWKTTDKETEKAVSEEISVPTPETEASSSPQFAEGQKTASGGYEDEHLGENERVERVIVLKKRAEYLLGNSEYEEAAQLYERILRLSPSADIEKKLAHLSFQAKNFQRSSDLYKNHQNDLYQSEKEEFLHALRYTRDEEFLSALENLKLAPEIYEAFSVSWKCENEYITCENIIREAKYDSFLIKDLRNALKNYEFLGNKDANYKDALLIGAMYKNEEYTTAIKIGENVLKKKSDYRPILKIVGFSSFMIGQYERAQGALSKYKKLEPKDPEADFILGLLHFEKEDYETSNIYFNKAVLSGYKPKIVVERKLAYNYFVLGRMKNMFQVLGYLMLEPDVTEPDGVNALYLALRENEIRQAGEWIKIGREKFPNSESVRALEGWYQRLIGDSGEAQRIIDEVLAKNPDNLTALVQSGILAFENGLKEKSKSILSRAQVIDAGGVWAETIEGYLGKLN